MKNAGFGPFGAGYPSYATGSQQPHHHPRFESGMQHASVSCTIKAKGRVTDGKFNLVLEDTRVKSAWRRLKPAFFGFIRVWGAVIGLKLLKTYWARRLALASGGNPSDFQNPKS